MQVKKILGICGLADSVTVLNDGTNGILNHKVRIQDFIPDLES